MGRVDIRGKTIAVEEYIEKENLYMYQSAGVFNHLANNFDYAYKVIYDSDDSVIMVRIL